MNNTYDDIRKEEHLDIRVKVVQSSLGTGSKRAFELTVEDVEGTQFPFIVWEKSKRGRNYQWREGHWYRLESAFGAVWPAGKELHGTRKLRIAHLGADEESDRAELLIVPDSHLGKEKGGFGASSWNLDCAAGFDAAIDVGIENSVDAVVHMGDIFHNDTTVGVPDELGERCRQAISRLADAQIPFYYIRGNHEKKRGRIWMERFQDSGLASHLRSRPRILNDSVAIYGLDHVDSWTNERLVFDQPPADTFNLLCLHQSLAPLTGNPDPDCEAREIITEGNISFDAISVGHLHKPSEKTIGGCQVFCSGATERFGQTPTDPLPSVEFLSIEGREFKKQRHILDSIL